jgi:hypothetical protein
MLPRNERNRLVSFTAPRPSGTTSALQHNRQREDDMISSRAHNLDLSGACAIDPQIPAPLSNSSLRTCAWLMTLPGGTLRVSQTLPPMLEPRPMVMRPNIVAPA